ncbi:Leucine-rich repeat-containing protein 74B [Camelus dromedarius]|uniref:Leucine-rich repeat-containing protein 74B n=1 Tax=Camelus dromedarius TaxID=9838 RepID=A0A5N4C8D3_CAMDR|nr:Leucine-rich repeat-containing protein 74B [Camelus dromedarius]
MRENWDPQSESVTSSREEGAGPCMAPRPSVLCPRRAAPPAGSGVERGRCWSLLGRRRDKSVGPGCSPVYVSPGRRRYPQQPTTRSCQGDCCGRRLIGRSGRLFAGRHLRLVNGPEGPPTFPAPGSPCSAAQSRFGVRDCQVGVTMRTPCEGPGEEEQEEGAVANTGRPEGVPEAQEGSDSDLDSDLETEGTHGLQEWVKDTLYLRSCRAHGVVPASCFLRQGSTPELNLQHRGLGPQGARALASALTSNPYIKRLDLRDNGLCGPGAEALAGALSKSSSICDVDLSENQLGAVGAQAVCSALVVNPAMQKVQLAGNDLEEQAAQYLAELLVAHTGLKSLDLSYNQLNDQAASWAQRPWPWLPPPSPVVPQLRSFASQANIFLRVLDISYNGCGDTGASALGGALKTNNMLEELIMSNNRISAAGALSLGLGLRVNRTLRILVVSRNPMRSEGCFGVLKSVQANPFSALELLDFSDIQVNREFKDLASSLKVILPGLCIKTVACRVEYEKELLSVSRSAK